MLELRKNTLHNAESLTATLGLDAYEVAGVAGVLVHLAPRVVRVVIVAAYFVHLEKPLISDYCYNMVDLKTHRSLLLLLPRTLVATGHASRQARLQIHQAVVLRSTLDVRTAHAARCNIKFTMRAH